MNSIEEPTPKGEINACAEDRKGGIIRGKGPSESIERTDDATLFFSRELATTLNPSRPDITAAVILFGLYLWQKKPIRRFQYCPKVNGERGSYRSLSELQAEYPWLTEEAIRKTLKRSEKTLNNLFKIDRANASAIRGKLHFWISEKLATTYRFDATKGRGLLAMSRQDVLKYGVLEAILISNLEFVTDEQHNTEPLVDAEGRIYRELCPKKLTDLRADKNGRKRRILPTSKKCVEAAIAHLRTLNVLIEHSSRFHFYRLSEPNERLPKVARHEPKVASSMPKVARRALKVARQNAVMPCKVSASNALQPFVETPYTNTSANADTKTDTKCLSTETVSLRSPVPVMGCNVSAGAKKLMELVRHTLATHAMSASVIYHLDDFEKEMSTYAPLDDFDIPQCAWEHDLPYDIIPIDPATGEVYSRRAEIDYSLENIELVLQINRFPYTQDDLRQLRKLFELHDGLNEEHIIDLIDVLQPQTHDVCLQGMGPPKKGHDFDYFARRIDSLGGLLRYLPQLVRECHLHGSTLAESPKYWEYDAKGRPQFSYAEMEEPYLSLAFANEKKVPVTYVSEQSEDSGEWVTRPVFFPEFAKLPVIEHVEQVCNPVPL